MVFVVSSHSAKSLSCQFRLAVASFGNQRSNCEDCEVHRKLSVLVVHGGPGEDAQRVVASHQCFKKLPEAELSTELGVERKESTKSMEST